MDEAKPNEIFQYSIISALMDGVASQGLPLSDLLRHGDHGLGTFRHIVGELIVLDHNAYQMKSDGSVTAIDVASAEGTVAPFAMITLFRPTLTAKSKLASKEDLFRTVSQLLPTTKNIFIAIRVEGLFSSLTVRTAGGQSVPGESLVEVGKHQTSHTFTDVRGTIIGFRSPEFTQGISVAGDHLHFISEDRKRGGHLLALQTDAEVEVSLAAISDVHLKLPTNDPEYDNAPLKGDSAGIAAVEG